MGQREKSGGCTGITFNGKWLRCDQQSAEKLGSRSNKVLYVEVEHSPQISEKGSQEINS